MIINIFFFTAILLIGIAIGIFIDICLIDSVVCTRYECEYRTYDKVKK